MWRCCLICEKEWGPGISTCRAEGSLVATTFEGAFKRKDIISLWTAPPVSAGQLDEMKRVASARSNQRHLLHRICCTDLTGQLPGRSLFL